MRGFYNMGSMIPGLVLAAGRSSRMGRAKATLPLGDGDSFLTRIVRTYLAAGVDDVVVVLVVVPAVVVIVEVVVDIVEAKDCHDDAGSPVGFAGGAAAAAAGFGGGYVVQKWRPQRGHTQN